MIAIMDEFGPRQLVYGSDFPVSHQRGRSITLGTGFAWVATDQLEWNDRAFFGQPIQVGLEEVRAIFHAADRFGLNEADLQDVFCDNAERLLGLRAVDPYLGQKSYERALTVIPRGNHLLSKNPDRMAPGQWPPYFREARGCEVWDEAGRHFYDCSSHGIGATILGFRDPDVTRAVIRRVSLGSCSTLNPREELELADLLCGLHPWAERVRLARTGGETMTVAVRIARATTDRSVVAISGYHGWHDWYLAANLGESDALRGHLMPGLEPLGVPRELRGTAQVFEWGDLERFDRIIAEHGDRLAAVVMEPCRGQDPDPGYLEHIRAEAHRVGALLIFDETSIGFRLERAGAHARFGVDPDLAAFGKSLGNGHAIGAVIGTAAAMEGAEHSFISSSYWTEGVGPAAAVAAVTKMTQQLDVPALVAAVGERVKAAWRRQADAAGVPMRGQRHLSVHRERYVRPRAGARAQHALHAPDAGARLPGPADHLLLGGAHGGGARQVRAGDGAGHGRARRRDPQGRRRRPAARPAARGGLHALGPLRPHGRRRLDSAVNDSKYVALIDRLCGAVGDGVAGVPQLP